MNFNNLLTEIHYINDFEYNTESESDNEYEKEELINNFDISFYLLKLKLILKKIFNDKKTLKNLNSDSDFESDSDSDSEINNYVKLNNENNNSLEKTNQLFYYKKSVGNIFIEDIKNIYIKIKNDFKEKNLCEDTIHYELNKENDEDDDLINLFYLEKIINNLGLKETDNDVNINNILEKLEKVNK